MRECDYDISHLSIYEWAMAGGGKKKLGVGGNFYSLVVLGKFGMVPRRGLAEERSIKAFLEKVQ